MYCFLCWYVSHGKIIIKIFSVTYFMFIFSSSKTVSKLQDHEHIASKILLLPDFIPWRPSFSDLKEIYFSFCFPVVYIASETGPPSCRTFCLAGSFVLAPTLIRRFFMFKRKLLGLTHMPIYLPTDHYYILCNTKRIIVLPFHYACILLKENMQEVNFPVVALPPCSLPLSFLVCGNLENGRK